MAEAQPSTPALAQDLASIAARAQTYTGASGAAIALSEGDANEVICRACSGPAAPDVGAAISLEGTFSGMAVQSGQALRCDDSDSDSRVDAAACRALGTRSIVVVPIRDADTEQVSGVLAVFAGNKNAFNDLHVAVLRTMAREVAVAVQKSRKAGISIGEATGVISAYRAPSSPGFTPPVSTTKPGPVPVPSASAAAAAPKAAPEIAPTVMTPAPRLAPPVPPPPPKADPHEQLPMATPVVPSKKTFTSPATQPPEWKPAPPPPPRKVEPIVEKADKKESRHVAATFGTFDSVAEDKKPGGGGMGIWIGVGVAAAVIVGGYFTYNAMSSKPSAQPAQQQAQTQAPAPAPADATTQPAATPAPQQTASSTPAQPTNQPQQSAATSKPATQPTSTATAAAKPAPQAQQPAQQQPPPAQQPKQAVERAAVTPNPTGRAEAPPQPVAAVPQIQVPISTAAPTLAAPKVSQSTSAQLVSSVPPKYPDMARQMHATGNVVMEATIGADGSVKSVRVISGHPLLKDAAASAVRQWKYKPATLNGQPVDTTVQVTVKFGG